MSPALISLVLPVYNESANIAECLRRLERGLAGEAHEILVCYDLDEDTTLPAIAAMPDRPASVRLVKNSLGRGAPKAMRAGFLAAQGDVIVTTMADLSDPPELVPRMAALVRAGADVVSGSRYMRGGSQQGGPLVKRTLSRTAGMLLHWICGLRTHDPTNNFRAYSPRFLASVEVESARGFEIALELTVKAHLSGARVTEIPSSWVDRSAGKSNFKLWKWLPNYLRWFARAILAPLAALCVLGVCALLAGSPGFPSDGIALFALVAARLVRGRNTRWDVLQPALWILPPLFVQPGAPLWSAQAAASLGLFLGSRPLEPPVKRRALFALYWLALWLAQVMPVRVIADDALDPSWSRCLGRFLAQGLKIGQDYVFTYGPLGYFSTSVYEPALFWHKLLVWEIGWRLVASWFVARALWDGRSRVERSAALALLLAIPLFFDAFAFAVVFAVASVLAREERPGALPRTLGFLLLGSLALVKFTFAVAAGGVAAALVLQACLRHGRKAALQDAGLALAGLLGCWFAAGQSLANFLPWLSKSLAIAAAYNEGESKPASTLSDLVGLATLGCLLFLLARWALARPRGLASAGLAAALGSTAFLAFKAGYVRGDDHTSYYLGFALAGCWLLPSARAPGWLAAGCSALALLGIFGAPEQEGVGAGTLAREFAARLPLNLRDVLLPWRSLAELEQTQRQRAARFDLPRIRERVGRDPVDVFDFHQGVALLNGLDYQPRPLFQSYVAFTSALQELDVRYYESARAPRWVLFKLETIDDRLPTMEHARLLETLLRWYRPALAERRELLLERRPEPLPALQRANAFERELEFGEELPLPPTSATARLLSLDIRRTALGSLAQFLYRAPEIQLEMLDQFGNRRRARVVPGMMRTGVLVDPLIGAGDDWVRFLVGAPLPRLVSLRLVLPEGWSWMYGRHFGLKLEDTQAPPRDGELSRELAAFVFPRMPDGMQLARAGLRLESGGHDCFFVFAPASMAWTLPAGKHSLAALFGMTSDPRRIPSSPRACFRVALVDGTQQKLLLERWVDLSNPEERRFMKLDLEFEAAHDCQLILATALPEGDTRKNAWCFWSEVKLR